MKSYAPRTETGKRKLKNMRIDVQKKGTYICTEAHTGKYELNVNPRR
jgi:hypothetical protein